MKRLIVALVVLAVTLGAWAATTWTRNGVSAWGPTTLQSAATTGNGTELLVNGSTKEIGVYTTWGVGTSAGAVIIETSDESAYAGDWHALATVTWAKASTKVYTKVQGSYSYIRARIGTNVVGGTVTVTAVGTN